MDKFIEKLKIVGRLQSEKEWLDYEFKEFSESNSELHLTNSENSDLNNLILKYFRTHFCVPKEISLSSFLSQSSFENQDNL